MQPTMIGNYRVVATLGRGGMAEVYLAVRRSVVGFTKLIVIKKLRSDLSQLAEGAKYRALLLDEARLAARLEHPNIVQTFEVGEDQGEPFLAMEYLDGQPLNQVVAMAQRKGVPVADDIALRVVMDVLRALQYAHDLKNFDGSLLHIVHRDVSPQNIFLTYAGEVKLVDFGVAKFTLGTETDAGVVKGKAAYMSPEQANGQPVDGRTDVFAAGIVLWELLAGKRLMKADSAAASLRLLLFEAMPPLDSVRPGIHPEIARICSRALERDLAHRYASAAEMAADIENVLETSDMRRRSGLADFVQALFVDERREADERIRAVLLHEQSMAGQGTPPPELATLPPVHGFANAPVSGLSTRSQITQSAPLPAPPKSGSPPLIAWIATPIFLAVVVAAGTKWWMREQARSQVATASSESSAAGAANSAAPSIEPSLRLCGSNTVGSELAPALVEAFLKSKGATTVSRSVDAASEQTTLAGAVSGQEVAVRIQAKGTSTAFEGLTIGTCDIGMASRAISDAEAGKLTPTFGDLRAPATEQVIALDGIAVIVNPNNRVAALDRKLLHDVFVGKTRDWSAVGGAVGPISVLARDQKSGTFDTFKSLVLGDDTVPTDAKRFEASDQLSDAVSADPSAVGFIGLAYVRSAKAIAVGDAGGRMTLPTPFTVTTEDYMLARRLYFYTTPKPHTPLVPDFVSFVLSPKGQAVVKGTGFVSLDVSVRDPEPCGTKCPARYATLTAHAKRLSISFRFRSGSDELDSRATRDIDRLVAFLGGYPNSSVVLLGFSDPSSDAAASVKQSKARAGIVEKQLTMRGIKVSTTDGFGSAMPIAATTSPLDRDRDRRVEVWLKP